MYLIEKTSEFDKWLRKLKDRKAKAKILVRIQNNMNTSKFDIADYLEDDEMIQEYLNTVLEEGEPEDIITALRHVAKAIGMSKIAEQTGFSRTSLYKALSDDAKPQFNTILKVLRAVGSNLKVNTST